MNPDETSIEVTVEDFGFSHPLIAAGARRGVQVGVTVEYPEEGHILAHNIARLGHGISASGSYSMRFSDLSILDSFLSVSLYYPQWTVQFLYLKAVLEPLFQSLKDTNIQVNRTQRRRDSESSTERGIIMIAVQLVEYLKKVDETGTAYDSVELDVTPEGMHFRVSRTKECRSIP